jgi:hypothetical protein
LFPIDSAICLYLEKQFYLDSLIRRYPRLCVFAYEYFVFLGRVTSPSILGRPVCLS